MNLRTFFNSGRRYCKHQPIIVARPGENLMGRVEKLLPGDLSDLGNRSEHGGRARENFHDFEAHSGTAQRKINRGDLHSLSHQRSRLLDYSQVRQSPGPVKK